MKTCALKMCYYHKKEQVQNDNIILGEIKCDHCSDAFYHTEFCKGMDRKNHSKCCKGNKKKEFNSTDVIYEKEEVRVVKAPLIIEKSPIICMPKLNPRKILNNYEILEERVLGEGSYGKVVYGRELLTNEELAIKIVSKQFLQNNSQAVLLKREIFIQRKLRHQNILSLKDCFEDDKNVYLILEYASNGTLFEYIQKRRGLSERECFIYFLQACLAVDTLHKNSIIHRDIKPENLLLDKAKKLKLCDFGCSFQFLKNSPKIRKTFCGTVDYMAPEFFQKNPHGMAADVWALGILLYEMAHAHPPFDTHSEGEKVVQILDCENVVLTYKSGITEEFQDLVENILRCDPKDRFTFDEIFEHEWIKRYEKKLNINIDRLRFKDSIIGNFMKEQNQDECFSDCNLRPTEVMLFADEEYLSRQRLSYNIESAEDISDLDADKENIDANEKRSSIKLITARGNKILCSLDSTGKKESAKLKSKNTFQSDISKAIDKSHTSSALELEKDEKSVQFLLQKTTLLKEKEPKIKFADNSPMYESRRENKRRARSLLDMNEDNSVASNNKSVNRNGMSVSNYRFV